MPSSSLSSPALSEARLSRVALHIAVCRPSGSWSPPQPCTTVTWDNQPAVAAPSSDSISTPATVGCYTWPLVKSDVEGWVVGSANNGWSVADSVEDSGSKQNSAFRTREDTAVPSEQPNLLVVSRPCTDLTAPGAPASLSATGGDGQVALNWDDNPELDLAGYNVYRSTSPGGPHAKINW